MSSASPTSAPPTPLVAAIASDPSPDALFESFSNWVTGRGITLYPAQEDALLELFTGANVVLATPTGSGKSLVAVGAHYYALAQGIRSVYTAPIKALVSEKFFDLCAVFGAANVGMQTGDAAVNPEAPIIVATAEVLANQALRQGSDSAVRQVIMDEFHYYGDPERGWAWQVPLLELPNAQFLLMSATLGDTASLRESMSRRTSRPTALVAHSERPVPLVPSYAMTLPHETIDELITENKAPIYIVHFTQAAAVERAMALMSTPLIDKDRKAAIKAALGGFRFAKGFGVTLSRLVHHGIGVHHAGMLPKYRRLVERLAQDGLLAVVCGTDTLGVGINVPIRTVLMTGLVKYDGVRMRTVRAREFHQIAGRAGRAGHDTVGYVVVQAPDHEIENERALAKAGDDPKKRRKVVRRKPPEGQVSWSHGTYERLISAEPEPLTSHFRVSHALVLNVIARPGNAFEAMRHLLTDNDDSRAGQRRHVRRAVAIYRSLLNAGIIERLDGPDEDGRVVRLTVDVQADFALNQPLSPFAVAALELLDRESPTYALDVVSIVESVLDPPRQVLAAQLNRARGEAVAAMKSDGLEYDERMALLDDITYPTPLEDLLEGALDIYRTGHPWVDDFELTPKSIVREMYENAMTFGEYVAWYSLARSEGLVLRYLADAYRTLRRTVPEDARDETLTDLTEWLGELVRQVDSSLLDEWESLIDPQASAIDVRDDTPRPVTTNTRAFRVLVRNAMFRRVELAALRRWDLLGDMDSQGSWDAERWSSALAGYFAEYDEIGTGPTARGPSLFMLEQAPTRWVVRQTLDDPAGDHDWALTASVDLAASDEAGEAVLTITHVGPASDFSAIPRDEI